MIYILGEKKMSTKELVKEDMKIVSHDGKKCFEIRHKVLVPVSDYGIETVKGSEIEALANIPVTFKIDHNKDYIMLKGYLNNKLIPNTNQEAVDSYGDIPVGKGIYNLERLTNNPIAILDHENSGAGIVGNYIYLQENKQGLKFKEILRPLEDVYCDDTKDAVSAWGQGFGKAYSIGGRFLYDWEQSDPQENRYILVKAFLHEASHVAIGADQWALSAMPDVSFVQDNSKGDIIECKTLEEAVLKYLETDDEAYIEQMEILKKGRVN
jgi:hypothetical protein